MNRRDMLKTLGATAAGIAAAGLQGAEAAEQNEPFGLPKVRVSGYKGRKAT